MQPVISISGVSKAYANGVRALDTVNLDFHKGEIFALLGPNGAGKTTLINIVCGLVKASGGTVTVDGHDNVRNYRQAREKIGLVPQELAVDMFETVIATVSFSRELFGKAPNKAYIEQLLRDLSLWEKRKAKVMELSGGMKRRVVIAKALAHEPEILFLDEPTAGVDVELRKDMWKLVHSLRERGVTIILTTHYIEEAEDMADRVGIIRKGDVFLVDDKVALMKKLGKRQLALNLHEPLSAVPSALGNWNLTLRDEGSTLLYSFDANEEHTDIPLLLRRLTELEIGFKDLETSKSSLEEIFVGLINETRGEEGRS
ncbi:MAG TPA: ABC transporter ATP-binding protein [Alphaproteobacteria bacterium]|nr:ABC transporter ATP-binding protein [Alphaproteobacteria bacterium]